MDTLFGTASKVSRIPRHTLNPSEDCSWYKSTGTHHHNGHTKFECDHVETT